MNISVSDADCRWYTLKDYRRGVSLKIKTGIQQGQGYIRNAAIITDLSG